jgi:hypothetical protein
MYGQPGVGHHPAGGHGGGARISPLDAGNLNRTFQTPQPTV